MFPRTWEAALSQQVLGGPVSQQHGSPARHRIFRKALWPVESLSRIISWTVRTTTWGGQNLQATSTTTSATLHFTELKVIANNCWTYISWEKNKLRGKHGHPLPPPQKKSLFAIHLPWHRWHSVKQHVHARRNRANAKANQTRAHMQLAFKEIGNWKHGTMWQILWSFQFHTMRHCF